MRLLAADLGFLPIVAIWVVAMIFSRMQKAKRAQQGQGALNAYEPPEETSPAQLGMMDELRRAMEELKRAELQTEAHERGLQQPHLEPPHREPTQRHSVTHQPVRRQPQPRLRVDLPKARKPDTTRHPIYVESAHAKDDEGSQEVGEERTDYDEDAVRASNQGLGAGGSELGTASSSSLAPSPQSPAPRSPLAHFADGTPKSALILATILGRPISEEPHA